jgi:DNA-binding protein HU-beta
MASVTKADLVKQMARAAGITRAEAEAALGSTISTISAALSSGDKVTLVGFGTFLVSERSARVGTNPRTKQKITIPASKGVRFKAGRALRDVL